MAGSVNKVILLGNLGRDPEIRSMQSGSKMASFSIATSKRWKDKQTQEYKDKTEWHKVVVFGEGLVVLGMVLNSLTGRYANAQEESVNVETNEQKGSENVTFKNITCESIVSKRGFWILVHGV